MATYYIRADGTAVDKAAATGPDTDVSKCMTPTVHTTQTFSGDDILYVSDKGGDYATKLQPPSSGTSGHNIVYQNIGHPIFTGDGSNTLYISSKSYLTFNGIVFSGRLALFNITVGAVCNYCVFKNSPTSGVYPAGAANVALNNCVVHANGAPGSLYYGINIDTTGNTLTLRNCLIYGNAGIGMRAVNGNTVDYDYNLIVGNSLAPVSNISLGNSGVDGGHNITTHVPKIVSHKNNTAYFVLMHDMEADIADAGYWLSVVAALPTGVKTSVFVKTYPTPDWADVTFLDSLGHEVGIHCDSHTWMNNTTAFQVTTTNANPTVNVDVAGQQIILSTTTGGNSVTLAWAGNKRISDLKTAVTDKGWTITNTSTVQDGLQLSSCADSAGAQVVPYTVNLDISAPNYMFWYNEVQYPKDTIDTHISVPASTFVFPGSSYDTPELLVYMKDVVGLTGASRLNYSKTLSSIDIFQVDARFLSTTLKGDGTEATIRALANHFYVWGKDFGYLISFSAHESSEFTAQQWGWLADELVKLGAEIMTLRDAIARIKTDHSTADGMTYTKTYADVSNYHLNAESLAIDAGVAVSGLTTDYEGSTVPYSSAPDIGIYEHHDTFVYGKGRLESGAGMTTVTRP